MVVTRGRYASLMNLMGEKYMYNVYIFVFMILVFCTGHVSDLYSCISNLLVFLLDLDIKDRHVFVEPNSDS